MKYLALLRGINVGGKTKIEMSRLKQVFETCGCSKVRTYINSGNVLFSDARPAKTLTPLLEKAIADSFGLNVPVVLRDQAALKAVCQAAPDSWTNDTQQKTDVMFLWDSVDAPDILDNVVHNPDIENVLYVPGAIIWNISRDKVTRGNGIKLIKTDLYKHMTVRNINTVRKLLSLMASG